MTCSATRTTRSAIRRTSGDESHVTERLAGERNDPDPLGSLHEDEGIIPDVREAHAPDERFQSIHPGLCTTDVVRQLTVLLASDSGYCTSRPQ